MPAKPSGSARAAVPVQRHAQRPEAEQRALEAHRRERDAELGEQVVLRQGGGIVDVEALGQLGQHRRGGLRDGAAAAVELDVGDLAVDDLQVDRELVAAERVDALGGDVGILDVPVVAGVLVVVEDVLAVQVVHRQSPKIFRTRCSDSIIWSISSGTV